MFSSSFTSTLCFLLWLAINGVYAETATCSANAQAMMKLHITHTLDFCNWYITRGRQVSPLPKIDAAEIIANCLCLGAVKPATVPAPSLPAVTTTPAKCVAKDVATVQAEFILTPTFCDFYNAWPYNEGTSPIKGLSAQRTYNACSCIIAKTITTTSSTTLAKPSTSMKATSSSGQGTTSAKKGSTTSTTTTKAPQASTSFSKKGSTSTKKSSTTSNMAKSSQMPTTATTTTTTTTPLPFCSSSAAKSLVADPYASTFCGSISGLTASTQTVYVSSTSLIPETTVESKKVVSFAYYTQEQDPYVTTVTNTVVVKTLTEICGTTGYTGLSKRDLPTPALLNRRNPATPTPLSTPSYLTTESPAFQTSACGCLPYVITAPTISETLTTEIDVSTLVTQVVTSVVVVSYPILHQSTTTSTYTQSSTSTVYTPYSSLASTTTLSNHQSVTFQIVPQYTFVYGYGHYYDGYCNSFSECMALCAGDSQCVAAKFYDETGKGALGCSLSSVQYGGTPLADDSLCLISVDNANLGSAIVVHRS